MSERKEIIVGYIAVLAGALLLYIVSCAPGLLWQDSGMIQHRVLNNDIEGKLGLALSHPLFYVIAIGTKYIPAGQFAYKVNLVSAVAAAIAIANLFLFIKLWLGRNLPAILAAVTFALSHTFWAHASVAETYTLYIALFITGLIMLLQFLKTGSRIYLYLLGLCEGLAISNHMFASIPLICYSVFLIVMLVRKQVRIGNVVIFVVFWIIGAGLYEYLIIKNMIQTGDILGTLTSAAFGYSYKSDVLNTSLSMRILKENLLYIFLNFPTPNILLFFAGCYALFKLPLDSKLKVILLSLLILFLFFAFRYTVVDRYAFFIPFYCIVSIFAGVGAYYFEPFLRRKHIALLVCVFAVLPFGVYLTMPKLAEKAGVNLGTQRQIVYRNEYKYFLQPWMTGYNGAERFAAEALDIVEENSAIYADNTTVYPILCVQEIRCLRPDVTVFYGLGLKEFTPEIAAKYASNSALYVVSPISGYCPKYLLDSYDFIQTGVLSQAVKNNGLSSNIKEDI